MDVVGEIIKQGGLGLMAGTFLWLYLGEKKDHEVTRKENKALMDLRRVDAVDFSTKIIENQSSISQFMDILGGKIRLAKGDK